MALKIYSILNIILFFLSSNAKRLTTKQKKIINIDYPVNNKYINFIYISLVSLLENANKNSMYHIYIQAAGNFQIDKAQLLYDLENYSYNKYEIGFLWSNRRKFRKKHIL